MSWRPPPSCASCSTPRTTGSASESDRESAASYSCRYVAEILNHAELDSIVDAVSALDGPAALLCVERDAEACHRSLIASRLAERYGVSFLHL